VSAPQYHETLLSLLYPGHQTSNNSLCPTVEAVERLWQILDRQTRRQILIRLDAGFGTDENINWLLYRGYHVLSKGYSGKRAAAFARHVQHWHQLDPYKWIAPAPASLWSHYYRRTQLVVLRWQSERTKRFKHALLICSLMDRTLSQVSHLYDERAAIENEITADKSGLLLPRRRKKPLQAQDALVLLTDLAHNILAWTRRFWAAEPEIGNVGIYLIVNEILPIPGKLTFTDDQLVKARLLASHPLAKPVLAGLSRILDEF
jgi:Transposase DDE domain group 1